MATDSRSSELLCQRGIWAIFLVGFMGAGKTTVGLATAKRLGWRFVDLDDEIEARAGHSIAEIFRHDGEAQFRRMELDALKRLTDADEWREGTIIALGGGAFVQPEIRALMKQTGQPTVLLDATISELLARCRNSTIERPLAKDEARFRQLYAERQSAYAETDVRISTTRRSTSRIVKAILEKAVKFAGRRPAASTNEKGAVK